MNFDISARLTSQILTIICHDMKHIIKRKNHGGTRLNPWQEKIDIYSPTKLNKTKHRELIPIMKKKSNLITVGKSSYHLKYNLLETQRSQLVSTMVSLMEYMRNFELNFFTYLYTLSPSPLKDQGMRLKELNARQSREESHKPDTSKAFVPSKLNCKNGYHDLAYKDFCTLRKEEKFSIYSLLLSRKIPAHVEKSGHPLASPTS